MDGKSSSATARRVMLRLLPFLMLLLFINHIDRSNISYAALQMNHDLGLTPEVYGFAAGIFFIGYVTFEIPSNFLLTRFGARRWIARIMITWGLIATAMAWVNGATSLYALRFLLGFAEAGFLPGMFYYLGLWMPARARGKAISFLMSTSAITNVIGAPLSTWLLTLDGLFGLRGWQLMFLLEGLPAVVMGFVVLRRLDDKPEDANWLDESEKRRLLDTLSAERAVKEAKGAMTFKQGLTDRRVLLLMVVCFFIVCDNFGVVFWLPQIIKSLANVSNMEVGLLAALPYLLGGVCMILWGRHSDATGDRKWHLVAAAFIGAVGLAGAALAPTPLLTFVGLCVATAGIWSTFGVFWALPGDFLNGAAAASGFALINSFGTIGGFVGPYLVGFVRQHTQNFTGSLLVLAAFGLATTLLAMLLQNQWKAEGAALVTPAE